MSATLTQLLEQYKGDVRLVFRHLPLNFHKRALPAAHAAECARAQRQFWALNDALFGTNRDLSDEALAQRVTELPGNLKLDEWRTCFAEHRYEDRIQRDIKLAEQLGVRGTPAFFINGHHLAGAQPIAVPADRERTRPTDFAGDRVELVVPAALCARLDAVRTAERAGRFAVVLGALARTLATTTGQADLPAWRAGGVRAQVFAVWIDTIYGPDHAARRGVAPPRVPRGDALRPGLQHPPRAQLPCLAGR